LKDATHEPGARHLTLAERRIRELVEAPRFAPGQQVAIINLSGVPSDVHGDWSLWRITLEAADWKRSRILPLFVHDDGRVLSPSAKYIWDRLLEGVPPPTDHLDGNEAGEILANLEPLAREHGRPLYEDLVREHESRIVKERETGEFAFAARRRAVERIGLPAVREHRVSKVKAEETEWREWLQRESLATPELECLVVIRTEGLKPKLSDSVV